MKSKIMDFQYKNKLPEHEDHIARWLHCPTEIFSKWIIVDKNYKSPRPYFFEYVFCDGYPRENTGQYFDQHNAKGNIVVTPYIIDISTGFLKPDNWYEIPVNVCKEIQEKLTTNPDLFELVFPNWKPVKSQDSLPSPYYHDRKEGKTVLKHKYNHCITKEFKLNAYGYITTLCMAECKSVFEINKEINDYISNTSK